MENGGCFLAMGIFSERIDGRLGTLVDIRDVVIFAFFRFLYDLIRATSALVGRKNLESER